MNLKSIGTLILILPLLLTLQGCAAVVVAGAAAGGYIAYEKGYRVRNPVTKGGVKKESSDK
ncbi:MAG: hypothetical protein C0631_07505 [Sedimenticola sp.]|jgi:uncharacterized protein YceK|nr:MAG: hypothetical protein C0631_07505 [Sedimenticola sp.]